MTNEEIIRAGYATFNRGDWGAVPSFFADDAVIDGSVAFIGPVSYRGPEGAQKLMDEIDSCSRHSIRSRSSSSSAATTCSAWWIRAAV